MKKTHFLILLLFFCTSFLYGAVSNTPIQSGNLSFDVTNDDPCNAIPLTLETTCTGILADNVAATNSAIPDETCDGANSNGDVWFSAQVATNGTLIIQTNPGTLTDMGMAIYTGNCSTLTFHSCISGGSPGGAAMPYVSLSSMTPGSIVYIRMWDVDNNETGDFSICALVNCSASVTIAGATSGCSNTPVQLCATAGFVSYQWTGGITTTCADVSTVGTNTYTVTVTDADGCTATDSHSVTIQQSPAVTLSGPATACPESNPQICVNGFYNSYLWLSGFNTQCIAPTNSGNYTVTVTNAFGCTGSASKSIVIYPAATVAITGPSSACTGSSVQLCTPSGFSNYTWSNGDTTECINPTATNIYTVSVVDANGCQASDNFAFTLKNRPSATITGPATTCNSASATLCAPANDSLYQWSTGATTSCITTSNSGTYTVTVTGTNGCTSSSSRNLTVYPVFAMNATGPDTACSGANIQLCATSGSYTYQWSNGSSTACISPTVSGIYSVTATNTTTGCSRSASKGITIFTPLNAAISGPSSACIGSVVPLCATAGGSSYSWSSGQTTDCINVNNNGIYTVTISDVHGCTASATQTVVFSTSFTINITGPAKGCIGSNATLCVPPGYASYAWSTGETARCISVSSSGNYSVTVHDQSGCVANSAINLQFVQPPVVTITGDTNVCAGSIENWCVTAGFPTYAWSNGGNSNCINVSNDATYSVQVTDTNGCTATDSKHLNEINIQPSITESNGYLICNTSNPAYSYAWLINGSPSACSGDSCDPTFSGIYSVIVTDTISGCSEITSYNYINTGIDFTDDDIAATVYPNPFQGNQFGIFFRNHAGEKTSIRVFNSLGKLVYEEKVFIIEKYAYQEITLPETASGLFYLEIQNGKGKAVKRITKY